jgi:hypothetical protein
MKSPAPRQVFACVAAQTDGIPVSNLLRTLPLIER